MNYIYDIFLNFNTKLYEFYEWDQTDEINYIKKIPVVKVSDKILLDFIQYKVKIDEAFYYKIKNKMLPNIYNACIFTSNNKSLAVSFDLEKNTLMKSYLLLDEEKVVLKMLKKSNEETIKYQKLYKEEKKFLTRKEQDLKDFLKSSIKRIEHNKSMLEYIYYECFGKKESNTNKIVKAIYNNMNNELINKKLLDIFKLIKFDKKKYVC